MTITSLKPENSFYNDAFKIEFSDSSSLSLAVHYLPDEMASGIPEKGALYAGRELSSGDEEIFGFAAACYRAEKIAARLIARAEQNSFGLTAKLERRGFDAAAAKAVVCFFSEKNLLDDTRFAERWILSRLKGRKALSPGWLLASLRKRGINRVSAEKALKNALDPEIEYDLLLKYLESSGFSGKKLELSSRFQLKKEGFSREVIEKYSDSIDKD